ncbi:hypothetical protein C437_04805 [Haloarcula vallismortis ATCC 29715]|nr:hypothetical protein C437_04805 [Haloarcula vallismortis ATCC 29715]
MNHLDDNHLLLWRGTKQAQWAHFLANDIKIVLWNHEAIEDFRAVITGKRRENIPEKDLDLEQYNVEVKTWDDEHQLIEDLEPNAVNVVNVPGLEGDTEDTDYHMFFFRKKWVDIIDAVIQRSYGDFITLLMDEIGDIFPSQQQLRKPFYRIVRLLPPKLAQLRKNNAWFFGAAHSTHDTHYYFWKIKSNSIAYMAGANVKSQKSPGVNQDAVNKLDRGDIVMPGPDIEEIIPPNFMEELDWIPDDNARKLRLRWTSNASDLLNEGGEDGEEVNEQDVKTAVYRTVLSNLDEMREDDECEYDFSQKDMGRIIGKSQSSVSRLLRDAG